MATIKLNSSLSMTEAFESFIFSKSAQGVTDKTIKCYRSHFKSISNYLDTYICMQFILNRLSAFPCKHIVCHFTFSLQ